jgi:hypothetical protein
MPFFLHQALNATLQETRTAYQQLPWHAGVASSASALLRGLNLISQVQ